MEGRRKDEEELMEIVSVKAAAGPAITGGAYEMAITVHHTRHAETRR